MEFYFHPLGFIITFLVCLTVLFLPRRYAVIPIIVSALTLTAGQKIMLFSLDFYPLRILIPFTLLRIVIKDETKEFRLNNIDRCMIAYAVIHLTFYTISRGGSRGVLNAFLSMSGGIMETAGLYFCFRVIFSGLTSYEIRKIFNFISLILAPLALIMLWEHKNGFNIFSIFGDVPEISLFREGSFRAEGPFRQPILAGSFAAAMIPIYIALLISGKKKFLPCLGVFSLCTISYSTASYGPILAAIIGLFSMVLWRYRGYMRWVRRGMVAFLVLLAMFMKAPIWYLFSKVSSRVGGGGWHRSELINQAIVHLDEWYLFGTTKTAHWLDYTLVLSEEKTDITNQFIGVGVNAGLLSMILFILVIVLCYKKIGEYLKKIESNNLENGLFIWSLGVSLTVHVLCFFNVSYFDQTVLFYYLILAIIATENMFFIKKDDGSIAI